MRVKAPPRGFVPSAPCWNPNVFSSLLQNQPKPTLRAATIFRSADRDLRNKRSPRHAERSACRAITRGSGGEQPTHIYSIPTSAMRVKTPSRGFVPSAPCWNPNVLSSLLQNQPKPTPRAATIFRSADRDLRNKRSPRHAERSACRAITRGSGGEQPTHIYSIPTSPTSAMRVKAPSAGICTFSALLESECSFFSSPKPTQTDASSRHHFPICRPRHSDDSFPCSPTARSACRAITRGSGGEQPTYIYSIPTSAVRVKTPPRGFVPSLPCFYNIGRIGLNRAHF
jgi:hypothetical protein